MEKIKEQLKKLKYKIKENKISIFSKLILSIIFAIVIMLDSMLVFNGDIFSDTKNVYFNHLQFKNIEIFIFATIIAFIVLSIFEKLSDIISKRIIKKESKNYGVKIFFFTFIIILILWLPYILSYFPGGIFADTTDTLGQAAGTSRINNRNPILYALIMKPFFIIAKLVDETKEVPIAMRLFTVFQIISMDAVISYFIYWLHKKKVDIKYIIPSILFFGLFNLIPLYAISIWKDTPFSIALFVYIIYIAETISQDGKNLEKAKGIIAFVILSLLVVFLRNNGIYIICLVTLLLIILYRKIIFNKLKIWFISSIAFVIICFIIQGPVYNKLKLSTDFVESLGVLIQQICYVVSYDGNIDDSEREFINNLCPIETIKQEYRPCIVDKIKWNANFNDTFLEENKQEFFKVWLHLLYKNPTQYVKAYLLNSVGFWDVNKQTNDGYICIEMWPSLQEYDEYKQDDYINTIFKKSIREDIQPKTFYSATLFLFIILVEAQITIYRKKYKNLIIFIPFIANWLTIMIATPLAFSLRYVYILVLGLPIAFYIPFLGNSNKSKLLNEKEN